jgi:hypothetical protein
MSNKDRRKTEVSALNNIIKDCAIYDAEKTIAELREQLERFSSLLERVGSEIEIIPPLERSIDLNVLLSEIDAILSKPPEQS